MRCLKCGSHKLKYVVNRTKVLSQKKHAVRENRSLRKKKRSRMFGGKYSKKNVKPRTDFRAKCKSCGFEGNIFPLMEKDV